MARETGCGACSSSNRRRIVASGIGGLILILSAGVCWNQLVGTSQAKAPKRVALAPAPATGALGLDLIRTGARGNLVFSPDSIATALAMTGTGATGRTAGQIARTLRLSGPTAFNEVGDLQQAIADGQAVAGQGHPQAPTLELANGLFLQQGFPVAPAFVSGLQRHFGAAPEIVDFAGDSVGSTNKINAWVSEHTKGLIPQLFDSLPEATRLVLANAVYLKASWLHPFDPIRTAPAPFHSNAGSTSARFMHETEMLRYGSGRGYKAVALPYRASTLSLLVVLPSLTTDVATLQRRLGARGLARIARSLRRTRVRLSLPRFHLAAKAILNATLKSLGMPLAFSEAAEFSRITTVEPLKIEMVAHAADFIVDEEGTVAAAATGVVAVPLSKPRPLPAVRFNANRPFLFFLRDDRTGAVLFAGRLAKPASAGTPKRAKRIVINLSRSRSRIGANEADSRTERLGEG